MSVKRWPQLGYTELKNFSLLYSFEAKWVCWTKVTPQNVLGFALILLYSALNRENWNPRFAPAFDDVFAFLDCYCCGCCCLICFFFTCTYALECMIQWSRKRRAHTFSSLSIRMIVRFCIFLVKQSCAFKFGSASGVFNLTRLIENDPEHNVFDLCL